jgi:hypothetical protein
MNFTVCKVFVRPAAFSVEMNNVEGGFKDNTKICNVKGKVSPVLN